MAALEVEADHLPIQPQEPAVLDADGDGDPTGVRWNYAGSLMAPINELHPIDSYGELAAGSHPLRADSRLATDDDGDGCSNQHEPLVALGTGAYGVVLHGSSILAAGFRECENQGVSDGGYAFPPGYSHPGGDVYLDPDNRVWIWDGICIAGAAYPGNNGAPQYGECQGEGYGSAATNTVRGSNYDASDELWHCRNTPTPGTILQVCAQSDGYGWRRVSDPVILFPYVVEDVPYACQRGGTGELDPLNADADGDGVPAFAICQRDVLIQSDGTTYYGEAERRQDAGDPDDTDPDWPIPRQTIEDEITALNRELNNATGAYLDGLWLIVDGANATIDSAQALIDAVITGGVDGANEVIASQMRFINQTRDTTIQSLETIILDNAAYLASLGPCFNDETSAYYGLVALRVGNYLNNPDAANQTALINALDDGRDAYIQSLNACTTGHGISDVLSLAVDVAASSLNQAFHAALIAVSVTDNATAEAVAAVERLEATQAGLFDFLTATLDTTQVLITDTLVHRPGQIIDTFQQAQSNPDPRPNASTTTQTTQGPQTADSERVVSLTFPFLVLLLVAFLLLVMLRRRTV